jgi:hypothetical protein
MEFVCYEFLYFVNLETEIEVKSGYFGDGVIYKK